MGKLAILGGPPQVKFPKPHFKWGVPNSKYRDDVINYLLNEGPLSIDGRYGIIEELENRFAEYHNVRYALLTSSGTTALHSAFFGVGIGHHDEVIAPAYTFLATVTPVLHCGGVPILCDCRSDNGNIKVDNIEELITTRTKAIAINHQWGHPVDISQLKTIAKNYGLAIVEDCSHALGATYAEEKVGTFGDVACISLQGNKLVYAGEGGVLLTNNQEVYERALLLGHYRKRTRTISLEQYKYLADTGYGMKYRIHPLGAVLANSILKDVDELIRMRNENLEYFSNGLKTIPGIDAPSIESGMTWGAHYGFKPKVDFKYLGGIDRALYVKALAAEGAEVNVPGSKPLNLYPLFQQSSCDLHNVRKPAYLPGDFPLAEHYYSQIISLPTFTYPAKELIDQYLEAIEKVNTNKEQLLSYERLISQSSGP
jgi:dTDP-4-amino-4,6-dideoxygalactose transaminase